MENQNDLLIIEIQKKIKRNYTFEENEFIIECEENLEIEDKKSKWKKIKKLFQEKFPEISPDRTQKELFDHFEHSLNQNIKRGKIIIEEQEFIQKYVHEKGRKWKSIAKMLNRNENQIKNEFYRKINPKKKEEEKDLSWIEDLCFIGKKFEEEFFFFECF
jgi:hypothetical protein